MVFTKLKNFANFALEKLSPSHIPPFLLNHPQKISAFLGYEGIIEGDMQTVVMSDGAFGRMWEVEPIAHEAMSEFELKTKISNLTQIFRNTRNKNASFQIIFDSTPSSDFPTPDWFKNPDTLARKFQAKRIEKMKSLAAPQKNGLRVMKRRVFICLRLEDPTRLGLSLNFPTAMFDKVTSTEEERTSSILKQTKELASLSESLEDALSRAEMPLTRVGADNLKRLCEEFFHSLEFSQASANAGKKYASDVPFREQLVKDFVEARPFGIQVGEDSWEVLSWLEQSQTAYCGMMTQFLSLDIPVRAVLNIRSLDEKSKLENKLYFLRNSNDSQSERQGTEVKQTLDRLEYGESLFALSMHVFLRNEKTSLEELKDNGKAKKISEFLSSATQITFLHERYSAPAIFFACLPFQCSSTMAVFISRERTVLSGNLGFYLPVFCGFKGTNPKLKTQIVQNRAGEVVYVSPRASETSGHVGVLASSGGGKSFWHAGLLVGELAASDSLHFIIDRKTSYEILAHTFGEEVGFTIAKPPESFPNIFKGRLDAEGDRLRAIVNVLTTAITLVSEDESVDAVKANLLSLAVQKTFEDIDLDARTRFDESVSNFQDVSKQKTPIPKLSDVVDNFLPVCEREGYEKENVSWLRQRLSPFYGNGPYATLFDRLEFNENEDKTPGISLFDLDGVANDNTLSTLTVLIIIADIVRQVKRPENRGKLGTITIEEAGVIGSSSKELITFIETLWKIFRKLGYCCIGLTNDSRDYKFKPGPKTIWRMSPNKVVLRMLAQDVAEALSSTESDPALFSNKLHGELISSLRKKDGVYSQGFWASDETQGTFTYVPTPENYWLAASKPEEVQSVHRLADLLSDEKYPHAAAVEILASTFPFGARDLETGNVRALSDDELKTLSKKDTSQ